MNKYEQLIEHIINDNEKAARELFHQIVVEKSRDIYESLMDEEQIDEIGGNPAADFVNDVSADVRADETDGLGEDEDMGDEELELDMDDMEGEEAEDVGGEDELADRVMDLESELDELKAEFDKLLAGEAGEEEHTDMFGGEEAEGMEDMGDDMEDMGDENSMMEGEDDTDEEDDEDDEKDHKKSSNKSQTEVMKEYVDKVKDLFKGEPGEGHEVAKGGSVNVNKGSVVAGKNDMGGTTGNIAKGGSEADPSGQKPNGKAGGFVKPAQEIDVAKRNVNKPGGNKGAQKFYSDKAKADHAEGATTGDTVKVQKSSLLGK